MKYVMRKIMGRFYEVEADDDGNVILDDDGQMKFLGSQRKDVPAEEPEATEKRGVSRDT